MGGRGRGEGCIELMRCGGAAEGAPFLSSSDYSWGNVSELRRQSWHGPLPPIPRQDPEIDADKVLFMEDYPLDSIWMRWGGKG